MMMELVYTFPCCWKREANIEEQAIHAWDEIREAIVEIKNDERERAIEELMDAIHCIETTMRMMDVSIDEYLGAKKRVIQKNKGRGYYKKEANCE